MIFYAAKFIWWLYVLLVNRSLIPYIACNGLLDYQHSYCLAAGGGYFGTDIQTVATKKALTLERPWGIYKSKSILLELCNSVNHPHHW